MALGNNLKKSKPETETQKTPVPPKVEERGKPAVSVSSKKTEPDRKVSSSKSDPADSRQSHSGQNQLMLIVFPVGDEEYAVSIDMVKEVVKLPNVAKVPQVPAYIAGIINVRGSVMTLIDLEKKMGIKKPSEGLNQFVIVVQHGEEEIGARVNGVPATLVVKRSEMDDPGEVMVTSGQEANYIKGVIKREKRMIILIDIMSMISSKDFKKLNTL